MKKHLPHIDYSPTLRRRITSLLLFTILLILLSVKIMAQPDTVNVPGDVFPVEGNLNNAIQTTLNAGTLSNTVFYLEPNSTYILTKTITVPREENLTIISSEPGITQETAPPQILWTSEENVNKDFNFNCYGDITLKNIWLLYADTEGKQIRSSLQINYDSLSNENEREETANFEGVIFDYSSDPKNYSGAVGLTTKHFKGIFKNCYFRNCIDSHLRYYGRAVSFPYDSKQWHIDSLLFENCTFANIGYVYNQEEGQYADNVYFNHCTFFNVMLYSLESGWWYKMSVNNSVFVNTNMFGDFRSTHPIDHHGPYGGTLRIDSLSEFDFDFSFFEQDRRILFTNSSYFIQDWLRDYMDHAMDTIIIHCRDRCTEKSYPQPMLNPGTLIFFDSTDNEGNKIFPYMNKAFLYDSTDPDFIFTPTNYENVKAYLFYKWTSNDDTNWAYKPELSLQHKWPFEENLAYTNETLLTAGMNGFPLGDLYRWFTNRYDQWKSQKELEYQRIFQWLNTGVDPGPLAVNGKNNILLKFKLDQNYPNPFNPVTHISYYVPVGSNVSLKVYNLLGQEVAKLYEGYRQPGKYNVSFDAGKLASGVYLYQLKADSFVATKKFILLK